MLTLLTGIREIIEEQGRGSCEYATPASTKRDTSICFGRTNNWTTRKWRQEAKRQGEWVEALGTYVKERGQT